MSDEDYYRQWLKAFHHTPAAAHRGAPVPVGPFVLLAAGRRYLTPEDLDGVDLLVPLTGEDTMPFAFGRRYHVLAAPLPDFGGVPEDWPALVEAVIAELRAGRRVLAFCLEGHGRTGCLLGSLIAVLESPTETPDPIAAVRARHCPQAVETAAQAAAIFALRRQPLPESYLAEFRTREHTERHLFAEQQHRHRAGDRAPAERDADV